MQVSAVNDHVTHAVIGANKAIDFSISDSAEFFQILSSTLYTNQKLAVVRETLCNAWDAHIEAGITDRPVEVIITKEKIIFRDFGAGIHDSKIGPIYGTYGGSTKVANIHVTGGFGLGCKAPFAYNDHFQVTSYHQGTKTIYAMSRSSAEVAGKPGITKIVSLPTTETGIEVSIDILNLTDVIEFTSLVQNVTLLGGMLVKLNGELLNTIPYEKAKHGFIFLDYMGFLEDRISVRYGNVVYPVPRHAAYKDAYDNLIHKIGTKALIILAPSNSISVTPSRESLSMQQKTIDTLTDLLNYHSKRANNHNSQFRNRIIEKAVTDLFDKSGVYQTLLSSIHGLYLKGEDTKVSPISYDSFCLRKLKVITHNTDIPGEYKTSKFIELAARTGFGKSHLLFRLARDIRKNTHKHSSRYNTEHLFKNWAIKNVIGPLATGMKERGLDRKNLHIMQRFRSYGHNKHIGLADVFGLTTGCILIYSNGRTASERLFKGHKGYSKQFGDTPILAYKVRPNSKEYDIALKFFKEQGLHVIDMVPRRSWEPEPVRPIRIYNPAAPKAKKITGLPLLSTLLVNGGLSREVLESRETERTEDFETVVVLSRTEEGIKVMNRNFMPLAEIAKLYGDRIGCAISTPQGDRYGKDKVGFRDWLSEQVLTDFAADKHIEEYASALAAIEDPYYSRRKLPIGIALLKNKDFLATFGITLGFTTETVLLHNILDNIHYQNDDLGKIQRKLRTLKPHKDLHDLMNKMGESPFARLVDKIEVANYLSYPDHKYHTAAQELIKLLAKG